MRLINWLTTTQPYPAQSLMAWSTLVQEANFHNMSAQLYYQLKASEQWCFLPPQVQRALENQSYKYKNQIKLLNDEVEHLRHDLLEQQIEVTFLKGAAYQLLKLSVFKGRLMADIDVLVRKEQLEQAEALLTQSGWMHSEVNDYDDKFYREWSQEIPPMKHYKRRTELDVHFNLLPATLKEAPDASALQAQKRPLGDVPGASTLSPQGLILHSIIHLFYESEYPKALRDLYDIHLLIQEFNSDDFWIDLVKLLEEMGNGDSVYLALRYCERYFGSQVPHYVQQRLAVYQPSKPALLVLDYCFEQVIKNAYPPHQQWHHSIAEFILFLRGHLKRMPLRLLIPHLIRKTIYRLTERQREKEKQNLI